MSDKREVRAIDANAADVEQIQCYFSDSCRLKDVQEWLDEQPTLDVIHIDDYKKCMEAEIKKRILAEKTNRQILENYAPVVHAKWIKHYIKIGNFDWKYKCSMCGKFNKQYSPPYCPHCGAKMDGGEDGENA